MKIQDLNISAASKSALKKHRLDRQTEMVALMQLENVPLTREALVKIERGIQHIQASQLRAIRNVLETTYDELLK
ncbi:MAG: transcriptional regulator [Lachnospiraceae bacterium]|nr:transcriptional regulator [Lachnospiraceae bacterium]